MSRADIHDWFRAKMKEHRFFVGFWIALFALGIIALIANLSVALELQAISEIESWSPKTVQMYCNALLWITLISLVYHAKYRDKYRGPAAAIDTAFFAVMLLGTFIEVPGLSSINTLLCVAISAGLICCGYRKLLEVRGSRRKFSDPWPQNGFDDNGL
ncbi:MAG TPA: hypothetical protein P5328_01265 [Candidatus Paceibacterota bacterium]|nr:hypothetical protein [Candidatus Paceibacterota bacterium]HRZ34614.1 hypothetical protein [Candidatus Paceibacterota bacterium]